MLKIIIRDEDETLNVFTKREELSNRLNDDFGADGSALKLELLTKDGRIETFFLAPYGDLTIIVQDNLFEFEPDTDKWVDKIFEHVDENEVVSYHYYKNYSFTIIIKRK